MRKNILTIFVTLLTILIVFISIDYVESEGFNPTDDGVILAQSFRLINGESPHKDFISIRPVFSGILHSIHFFSPMPLQISARWFVIFEFFVYSFLWVFALFKVFLHFPENSKLKYLLISSVFLFSFILNLNNYNLFPWTTIDAIFLSVIGFSFYNTIFLKKIIWKNSILIALGLLFFSLSALSRQSFVVVLFFGFLYTAFHFFRKKEFLKLVCVATIGISPIIFYFFVLLKNEAFFLFLNQMTGRTELVETGIIQFIKYFIKSKLLVLNVLVIIWFVLFSVNRNIFKNKKKKLLHAKTWILGFYFFATLAFSFFHFYQKSNIIYIVPFEFFWILISVFLIAIHTLKLKMNQIVTIFFVILLSWTSSISLGDNSPIFAMGLLGVTTIILIIYILQKQNNSVRKIITKKHFPIFIIAVVCSLFVVSIFGQRRANYRDLPSEKLDYSLGEIFFEFGEIRTNKNCFDYYSDFISIYNSMDDIQNNFVMLPNNSAIYPILKSRNPFPLDWMQHDEYIGAEQLLYEKIEEVLKTKKIYIFIDKHELKKISQKLEPKKYDNYLYDYLPLVFENCLEVEIESDFFKVFISNGF